MKRQAFDIIPQHVVDQLIKDYNSRGEYETESMNKAAPGGSLEMAVSYCRSIIDFDVQYCSGNFYRHSTPYLPHTDYRILQNNTINFVIPLEYTGTLPSLIVFDQVWPYDSITWCLSGPLVNFKINTGVKGNPCEYDILYKTGKEIDQEFYEKYLYHFPQRCYRELSAQAFPFVPGSVIAFDNRMIHCTSAFTGTKLGLSLRFRIND